MKSVDKYAAVLALVAVAAVALATGSPVSSSSSSPQDQQDGNNDVNLQQPAPSPHEPHVKPSSYVTREEELVRKLNAKCSARDASSCVMLKLVTYMNKLMKKNSLEIGGMMEIARKDGPSVEETADAGDRADGAARAYTDETAAFGEVMADKLWRYVQSRALKIKVLPEADFVVSASPARDGSLDFGMSFRSGKDLTESGEHNIIII